MVIAPSPLSGLNRINSEFLPPCEFVAALVELAMVKPTERDGEFVADCALERALLRK
jgi:hypothetical protein